MPLLLTRLLTDLPCHVLVSDYLELMKTLFDFPKLKAFVSSGQVSLYMDCLSGRLCLLHASMQSYSLPSSPSLVSAKPLSGMLCSP